MKTILKLVRPGGSVGLSRMLAVGAAALLTAGSAMAQSVMYYSVEVPPAMTDWKTTLSVPQFNPVLHGTLTRVVLVWDCTLIGTLRIENIKEGEAAMVEASLTSTMTLQRPALGVTEGAPITKAVPDLAYLIPLAEFDKVEDYDGPSGESFFDHVATAKKTAYLTAASDLALFTGYGMIDLPAKTRSSSSFTGAGNAKYFVETHGAVALTVCYEYMPVEEQLPGGGTPGFWSNKNGLALLTDYDFFVLNDLCLVKTDGTDADFGTLTPMSKKMFSSWIRQRNASNMAFQLSGQLAAFVLNVLHGAYEAGDLIPAPNLDPSGFVQAADLISMANEALCDDGYTPSGDPNRPWQEQLKCALDAANNAVYQASLTTGAVTGGNAQ